jgi:hypothetical protein
MVGEEPHNFGVGLVPEDCDVDRGTVVTVHS